MTTTGPFTIGMMLRGVRRAKGLSRRTVADRAGVPKRTLTDLETGVRSLTSTRHLVDLCTAVGVSPVELLRPVGWPRRNQMITGVQVALDAVRDGNPEGEVKPVGVLRDAVMTLQRQRRQCRFTDVATHLPGLIRDLHTTLNTGHQTGELLELAVYLHVHVTRWWFLHAGAPPDFALRAATLARHLAETHGDPTVWGVACFGVADTLSLTGSFTGGAQEFGRIVLPPTRETTAGFCGLVTLVRAVIAHHSDHPGDVIAALDAASDVIDRFASGPPLDSWGFHVDPVDIAVFRMHLALEEDDPEEAVAIAAETHPGWHPFPSIRASYWMTYGRALTRVEGRDQEAVRALRTAEGLSPVVVQRDPLVRDAVGELVRRTTWDPGLGNHGGLSPDLWGLAARTGVLDWPHDDSG